MLRKVQEERIASGEYEMSNGVLVRKGITVSWKNLKAHFLPNIDSQIYPKLGWRAGH